MSKVSKLFDDNKFYSRLFIFGFIELVNFCLLGSPWNLLITVLEIIIVLFLILKKEYSTALIFHIISCLTACDATSASSEVQLFSYPEVKLIGPLTVSYIILGVLWVINRRKSIQYPKSSMIYKFRALILYFLLYGTILGICGLLFLGYRFNDFITAFIYIFVGFLYIDIFIRNNDDYFLQKCKNVAISLLLAAPFISFISYFILNIRTTYSVFDALIYNEEFIMAPMLILFLFTEIKHRVVYLVSLVLYLACVAVVGRGGFFLSLLISLIILIVFTYLSPNSCLKYTKYLRGILPILIIIGGSAIINFFLSIESGNSLSGNKVKELISLIQALFSLGSSGFALTDISASPYIRVAEVLNLLHNGIFDPLGLIFGHGFGGVYTDSTGLFQNVDVTLGGFSVEVASSGRYGTAHSFLPSTLLFNGLIGVYVLLRTGIRYLRCIKYSPLCFAGYTLFLYSFYFNPSLFLASAFALYAAEYDIN